MQPTYMYDKILKMRHKYVFIAFKNDIAKNTCIRYINKYYPSKHDESITAPPPLHIMHFIIFVIILYCIYNVQRIKPYKMVTNAVYHYIYDLITT